MTQVIGGKVYDASKANRVCELASPTEDRGNFGWHHTELYRTAKGRFFIAGKGGPRSIWAERVDLNSWRGGAGIRAVTEDEARGYMEAAGCSAEEFVEAGLPLEEAERCVVQQNYAHVSATPVGWTVCASRSSSCASHRRCRSQPMRRSSRPHLEAVPTQPSSPAGFRSVVGLPKVSR